MKKLIEKIEEARFGSGEGVREELKFGDKLMSVYQIATLLDAAVGASSGHLRDSQKSFINPGSKNWHDKEIPLIKGVHIITYALGSLSYGFEGMSFKEAKKAADALEKARQAVYDVMQAIKDAHTENVKQARIGVKGHP
jgi:hypothetical protein